jgi:hypothetical protein
MMPFLLSWTGMVTWGVKPCSVADEEGQSS